MTRTLTLTNSTAQSGNSSTINVITTPTAPNRVTGTLVYLALVANGGTAPFTWAITSGTLPVGLTLLGNVITGTPTAPGTASVTLLVTDGTGQTATLTLSFVITAAAVAAVALPVPGLDGLSLLLVSLLLAFGSGVWMRRR